MDNLYKITQVSKLHMKPIDLHPKSFKGIHIHTPFFIKKTVEEKEIEREDQISDFFFLGLEVNIKYN